MGKNHTETPRENLAETAVRRVRNMIMKGELQPGRKITESSIASYLEISRTPMREAIRVLTSEGLLTFSKNRGAEVASYSPEIIRNSIEFIEHLEATAGRLATERATDREIDEIVSMTCEMKAMYQAKDRLRYYELNRRIHNAIMAASHNNVLAEQHARVNIRLFRIRYTPNDSDKQWASAMLEHEMMAKALAKRNAEELEQLLRKHLSYAWQRSGVYPQLGIDREKAYSPAGAKYGQREKE